MMMSNLKNTTTTAIRIAGNYARRKQPPLFLIVLQECKCNDLKKIAENFKIVVIYQQNIMNKMITKEEL